MEKLKKSRTLLRSAFTKAVNSINALIASEDKDLIKIQATLDLLDLKCQELQTVDKQVCDLLLETDISEDDLIAECSKADEYLYIFNEIKLTVQALVQTCNNDAVSNCSSSVKSQQCSSNPINKRKFKLPLIELKKFDGNLINWLPFWSQFSKIHNDQDIVSEDKFQYLLQSVVPGTRAYDLIQSFPSTAANYSKVIEGLKARFGKNDLLVEVYVRELLKLVLQNALNNNQSISLPSLYDKLESHLRALETLGVTTDKCASILYPLVESCLPEDLLRAWQRSLGQTGNEPQDRLDNLMKFMLSEVEGEQRIGLAMSGFGISCSSRDKSYKRSGKQQLYTSTPTAASLLTHEKAISVPVGLCIFCDKKHKSSDCFIAQKMALDKKENIIKEKKCCYCCLKPGHGVKQCRMNVKCALCRRRHLLIMCPKFLFNDRDRSDRPSSKEGEELTQSQSEEMTVLENDNVLSNNSVKGKPKVFMQTVVANLRNPKTNVSRPVRVLFDTGSQRSYVLENLAAKMEYEPLGTETIVHSLFGNVKSAEHKHKRYKVFLSNTDNTYKCNFEVLDQPTICGDISHITPGPWMSELAEKHISLTDVTDKFSSIDLLIGADIAGKLFTGKREQLTSGLVAMETLIGWTLMGKLILEETDTYLSSVVTSMFIKEADVSNLWKLDAIGISDPSEQISKEEKANFVEKHFLDTTLMNEEQRYEVNLPWIDGHSILPSNKDIAKNRLVTCTRKLDKMNLFTEYDTVFKQWLQDGIIEPVPMNEEDNTGHYLPHRPVVKDSSATTRIRPVFDASAKGKYSPSLNDCLESGPNLIELIPSVMLRFREGKYGVISDIAKAFLQISVNERDRDYLRFLWYNDKERNNIVEYRHKRVVFGVTCSPYLLGATIDLHLKSCLLNGKFNADVINKLRQSFYVDNVSTSVDTEQELKTFIKESTNAMILARFDLRGWTSSVSRRLEPTTNVLGIQWDPKEDVLFVNNDCVNSFDLSCITRRTILSIAHRVFDPIGFVCPVMLCPKLLLQRTWKDKGGSWDAPVDKQTSEEFIKWFKELSTLEDIKIPRWIGKVVVNNIGCTLHTFCDGSKKAYGTVIFLRVETESEIKVQLLAARSRVAPTKQTTIPRLELLAALVGARLTNSIVNAMEWHDMPVFYWTDSSTVLAWIKQQRNWTVFVQNRISEIKKLTDNIQWNHIPGRENPADLPSRGCTATQLVESRWWEGPTWMKTPIDTWPMNVTSCNVAEVEEEVRKSDKLKSCTLNFIDYVGPMCTTNIPSSVKISQDYSRYFSNYMTIIRVVSWTQRFIENCRLSPNQRLCGELTATEIDTAEKKLLHLVQQETWTDFKRITSLSPFVHEDGLIRLKTKIFKSNDSFAFRCPILLPAKHTIVEALIFYQHKKHCHAGVQLLMNILREDYWVVGGRRSIRAVISKCIVCKRQKAKRLEAIPATLPADRVGDACVFEVTGSDFAGPVYLKNNEKAWICVFTCGVYRAVHLELVTSLSADTFLQAFRRFIARRGRPNIVYSDNGTNYVGANNALKDVNWESIKKYSSAHRIHWKFSPPSAPWWGGWWERIVRLVKELLRRVLGKASIDYQEMLTILCDCEAVLNSRPLTYIYDGESDLTPLSPNHFLKEIRENSVPDIDRIEEVSLNKRLKYLQSLRKDLRNRFRKEYLGQLVQRYKNIKYQNLEVGEVVLLECDNLKRVDWPLAIVVEVLPDKDGTVRLARVKTQNGILLRPIQRLYPLEVTSKTEPILTRISKKHSNLKLDLNKEVKEVITRSGRNVKTPLKYKTLFYVSDC